MFLDHAIFPSARTLDVKSDPEVFGSHDGTGATREHFADVASRN